MRIIPDQLRSKNLVPFKKRQGRYKIPGMTSENEVLMDHVDPDLSQEEQSYVRHYLGYADALIRSAEENTPPEATPESTPIALSTEIGQKRQPPADHQDAGLINEACSAANDRPEKAA